MWRDWLLAASLANVCYVRIWRRLVFLTPIDSFTTSHLPGSPELIAAGLNVAAMTIILYGSIRLSRASARWLRIPALAVLVGVSALTINSLRVLSLSYLSDSHVLAITLNAFVALAIALVALSFVTGRLNGMRVFGAHLAIVLCPFLLLTGSKVVWNLIEFTAAGASSVVAPPNNFAPRAIGRRAVWIVFDEWDYNLTFAHRTPGLALPNLDRLAEQSLSATNAHSPASQTLVSLPSLLTGRQWTSARVASSNSLLLGASGMESSQDWRGIPSVFSETYRRKMRTAVAGWYLPYCRIYGPLLSSCAWFDAAEAGEVSAGGTLGSSMAQFETLLQNRLTATVLTPRVVSGHGQRFSLLFDQAIQYVKDPSLDFVFLHFPVPHPPNFRYLRNGIQPATYDAGLEAVDFSVGALVEGMRNAGLWERTVVLVSSDHFYRGRSSNPSLMDRRVPFLLHLPHANRGLVYEPPLATVKSGALLMAALSGSINSLDEAASWLAR